MNPKIKDDNAPVNLRPKSLEDFIGQDNIKKKLKIAIEASKMRGEHLDHILLVGPPGLGKTTLAQIVANELGVNIYATSGPVLERQGDLAAILTNLSKGDVLFIDEIHRMAKSAEELLYTAIEDFKIDIMIGKGPAAKSVRISLNPFTLIGATTRSGLLTSPFRSRFGIILELSFYKSEELAKIIEKAANMMDIKIEKEAAEVLGERSRGTPRIALRLLKRVRDVATVEGKNVIDVETVEKAMRILDIDNLGLDEVDRRILKTIIEVYGGGPVGLNSLAATLGLEPDTISEVYEPYLIQAGLLTRTTRGRTVTDAAYSHLGYKKRSTLFDM